MKYTALTLAISSALLTLNTAHAQSQSKQSIETIEVTGSYFNDYKVDNAAGAMRGDYSLLETAQSVTIIPDTIINEQLATTLGEALANDASLTPGSKQRNRETFNLRGFGLSSSNGYLRDGHQHWSHYQQPIETLESLEIIKGPSSILYGQSAPGGLVNMVTKKPTTTTKFDFGLDVDDLGSTRLTLDAGGAITTDESLRYRGVLVKQDVKYNREYQNGEQRERDRFLGSLVLDYDISDDLLVRIHYDRTDDKAGLDTGAWLDDNGDVIGDDKTIRDFSWAFTDITVENRGIDFHYYINDTFTLKTGFNAQDFSRQRFESAPSKEDDFVEGDSYTSKPYDRYDDWQFKTAFIDLTSEFKTGNVQHQLLIGANSLDYYYGQLKTKADEPIEYQAGMPEPTKPDISYKTDTSLYTSEYSYYGVYFQDLMTFSEQWQVSLGGRYDKQAKEGADNESVLPKFAALYHPHENATIYLSYAEGFEPQSSERLNDDNDVNDGMKLDAQTSHQYEIGTKWQLVDDRLMLNAAAFDISKQNVLVTEDLSDEKTRTTQEGEQRHKGVELSAQGAVSDTLFVMASTMYLDAEYTRSDRYQGKTPIDAPKWSASLWSRYEMSADLALNAGLFYEGERFADNNNTIIKDAYTRIDVGANYQMKVGNKPVNLRLNVENLFDTDYLGGGSDSNVTIGEERTLRLAVQFSL